MFDVLSPCHFAIQKSEEKTDEWLVYMTASDNSVDRQSEIVDPECLKKAADDFKNCGVISWNHQHRHSQDPSAVIGEPLEVKTNNLGVTRVKGRLYQKMEKAKAVWDMLNSHTTRLGASIGGSVIERDGDTIKKVIWNDLAITYNPINQNTFGSVTQIPYSEFMKALTAGSGVDANLFEGGRALQPESLQKKTTKYFDANSNFYKDKILPIEYKSKIWEAVIKNYASTVKEITQLCDLFGMNKAETKEVLKNCLDALKKRKNNKE